MLTRIRNGSLAKLRNVNIRKTSINLNICQILKEEGFIESFQENISYKEKNISKHISINLKYKGIKQKPYITGLKKISKPGFRVYANWKNVPKILGGVGTVVFCVAKINY